MRKLGAESCSADSGAVGGSAEIETWALVKRSSLALGASKPSSACIGGMTLLVPADCAGLG